MTDILDKHKMWFKMWERLNIFFAIFPPAMVIIDIINRPYYSLKYAKTSEFLLEGLLLSIIFIFAGLFFPIFLANAFKKSIYKIKISHLVLFIFFFKLILIALFFASLLPATFVGIFTALVIPMIYNTNGPVFDYFLLLIYWLITVNLSFEALSQLKKIIKSILENITLEKRAKNI